MHQQRAFSLVELSIVLVILGLLVGGILSGRSLIRAAELRSITTQYETLKTAVYTFRARYNAYPGDFPQATHIWGEAGKCGAGIWNDGALSTDGSTCNGNDSGKIDVWPESVTLWQHLSNAGMLDGRYNGFIGNYDGSGGLPFLKGEESTPVSRWKGAKWYAIQEYMILGNRTMFDTIYDNIDEKGVLAPQDAWGIDVKIDDGLPNKGQMLAMGAGCIADASGVVVDVSVLNDPQTVSTMELQYHVQNPAEQCVLGMPSLF